MIVRARTHALETSQEAMLNQTVEGLRRGGIDAVLEIRTSCEGNAATELVDKSKGVDMLVVASRGLGGFRGLLLGSVSRQCAQHAHCPVVIVAAEERS